MKDVYRVFFEPDRKHPKRAIKALVALFPGLDLDDSGDMVVSDNVDLVRTLFAEARNQGFECTLVARTELTREDALLGNLGQLAAADANTFVAKLPKNAFDFSTACPRCGLGARQVKAYVLNEHGRRCRGPFYVVRGPRGLPESPQAPAGNIHGRFLMRADIGYELVAAIDRDDCVRHPVTRTGEVIEEWLEPVPTGTLPPMSRKSTGVTFCDRCDVCGRVCYDRNHEAPERLVYSDEAVRDAQQHPFLEMFEPFEAWPQLDAARQDFKYPYGLPMLVLSRVAIEVLNKHVELEKDNIWLASGIIPVFSESQLDQGVAGV